MCEKMHSSWNSGKIIWILKYKKKRNCQETEMSFDCLYNSIFNKFCWGSLLIFVLFIYFSDSNSYHQSSDHSTKHRIIRPKLHHGRHKRAITSTLEEVCFGFFLNHIFVWGFLMSNFNLKYLIDKVKTHCH